MTNNEGKLNPGIDYQFEIITYAAACLSENVMKSKTVEDFQIHTNRNIPSFDDISIKVKYKSEPAPFVYLGQIRRYVKPKINFNAGKDKLQRYLEKIWKIKNANNRGAFLESLLKGVPEENIEFWFISNSFLSNANDHPPADPLKSPIILDDGTYCYLEPDTEYQSILPRRNGVTCYKLITQGGQRLPYNLKKFYVFLNQPDHNQVASNIVNLNKDLISIATANNMINFVNAYLKPQTEERELTKYVFETHLLRSCLSPFIVTPAEAFEIDPKPAERWNKLVMEFDVTLTSSEMESYIFGCLWQEIKTLFNAEFDWNGTIINYRGIIREASIENKFEQLVQDRRVRHWSYIPDTIMDLLIEMWKCDYLPLVLSAYTDLSILDKYKHLGKKFVILHRKEKLYNEVSRLGLRVFATAADIHKAELASEFLKSIFISLQGREPITLFTILNDDRDLMKQLKCDQLLYLIRERKHLLTNKSCLDEKANMFNVTSISETLNEMSMDDIEINDNENIIACKASDEDVETGRVRDEDGNDFYVEKDKVVPIIGKCFTNSEMYIKRCLRKPTVEKTISNSERKIICFLAGHFNSLPWTMNYHKFLDVSTSDIVSRIEFQIEREQSAFIGTKDEYVEELWPRFSLGAHPLLHIKVEDEKMTLLKYQNCPNISSYISYNGPKFEEESFFEETSTGITVITGEPGSGKTTLLRSLFNACHKHSFALFCDLKGYRQDLCQRNQNLFIDPINFILRKEEGRLTLSNKQYSKYHLAFIHKFLQRTNELILFLDSFDEVLPECETQVLDLIRVLINSNGRFIIASRLVMADILYNSLEVKLLKIDTFSTTDVEKYLVNKRLSKNEFNEYPLEFRKNPMYLNFLIALRQEDALPSVITPSTLYKAIVEKHIKHFYRENYFTPKQYEYKRQEHLEIYKELALLEIFDDTVTAKLGLDYEELRERCTQTDKLKLGLIVRFNDKGPIFLHRAIAEFLVAEWLSENIRTEFGKKMYLTLLRGKNMVHVMYLLDDILCRNLPLHQAVLQKDLASVKRLCSENDKYLEEVDELNRTALDIAASYCPGLKSYKDLHYLILEEIVHQSILKEKDLSERNSFTEMHWTDYLNHPFLISAQCLKLVHSAEMYFYYHNNIAGGFYWSMRSNLLDTAMALLKRRIHLLPIYFNVFVVKIVTKARMDLLSELIELQSGNNTELDVLCRVCKNLLPVTEVSACANLEMQGRFTAVHVACIYGHVDVVRELVRLGVEVNAVDDFQLRPLYYAIGNGSVEIVTILAELFKKEETLPSSASRQRIFPNYLHNSLKREHFEIAKILLDNGFDVDARNETGESALYVAVENCERIDSFKRNTLTPIPNSDESNIKQIKFLLGYKADCNIQDMLGRTPLHIAVQKGRLDVTQMLLSHGADINVKYMLGDTLYWARVNDELMKLLLQFDEDANHTNAD